LQAGREDLIATLTAALDSSSCDADLHFAAKHGLLAYRDRVAEVVDQFFRIYGPAINRMERQ
jgi:hypothetical protein